MKNREKIVFPGMGLATIEEYLPKRGVYEDSSGILRALFLGRAIMDIKNKELVVTPFKKAMLLEIGDKIIGRIISMSGIYGLTVIFAIKLGQRLVSLNKTFTGTLHPPRKSIRDVSNIYKLGDYIYALIISCKNRTWHLSIDGVEYGVIHAFCNNCGSILIKDKQGKLICKRCKTKERRKLSVLYGKVL